MLAGVFSSALWILLGSFILFAAAFVYFTLIRQISARRAALGPDIDVAPRKTFGLPEAFLATGLALFLLMNVATSFQRKSPVQLTNRDLIASFLFTLFVLFVIAGFLKLRRIDIDLLAGFSKTTLQDRPL